MPKIFAFAVLFYSLMTSPATFAANECAGTAWKQTAQSCRSLGLDSNVARCRSGDTFAMLCDDRKGGWTRTCSSGIPCGNNAPKTNPGNEPRRGDWDGDYVFYKGDWRHCSELRFNRKRYPLAYCDRGKSNHDCRRRCERGDDRDHSDDRRFDDEPRQGTWDGNFVYYRGQWRKCRDLTFSGKRPTGFCRDDRYNSNCRGSCEGWKIF